MQLDREQQTLTLALRTPDAQGVWARRWREHTVQMPLPDLVVERARGTSLAPALRAIVAADGTRYAVLEVSVEAPVKQHARDADLQTVLGFDWGVRVLVTASVTDLDGHQVGRPFFVDTGPLDGRQARLRPQIDQLTAKVARREQQRERFPVGDPKRTPAGRP